MMANCYPPSQRATARRMMANCYPPSQRATARRMMVRVLLATGAVLALSGCVVQETRPLAKVDAVQAVIDLPADERLDVAIRAFDPGIPDELANDEEALARKRIYPELRKAEARYFAVQLRNTLESTATWGAVRVVPSTVKFVDLVIDGRIIESSGKRLELAITARDSAGRIWLNDKRYEGDADIGSYKTDAALKARDPFQNVYAAIANDLLQVRGKLAAAQLREVRQVTEMLFAEDLAPQAMAGYVVDDTSVKPPLKKLARLPASEDPVAQRVGRIRERDVAVVDTLDGYYGAFHEQMQQTYGEFRRTSWDEIDKEEQARAAATTRTLLGVAMVAASILVPSNCNSTTSCNMDSLVRYGAAGGGVAAFLSGLKKYSDAKTHAQAFGELASSFQSDVAEQVVEVEGRSLKLSGTAEEQYREWRRLLDEYHVQEVAPPTSAR
jgi:hypothetical protein